MTELHTILIDQITRYPASTLQDFCKLLYQNEFGCGHLVSDLPACIDRIRTERTATADAAAHRIESIGNGFCRLYLSSEDWDEAVGRIFAASASRRTGSAKGFFEKIELLKALCNDGSLPFAASDVDVFIENWINSAMRPFSHSDTYREAYHPAYRVVEESYLPILPVLQDICAQKRETPVVVAIDGRCGSGKTTFASRLSSAIDCTIIHMDDFFLPPALRTPERLAEAGGNIHYERFREEVLAGISSGKPFSYGVFDCSRMAVTHQASVNEPQLIVIEGSYSLHPKFGHYADITVFCDVGPATQKERIVARNGEAMYRNFETRWIPMEERYFSAYNIKATCDHIIC